LVLGKNLRRNAGKSGKAEIKAPNNAYGQAFCRQRSKKSKIPPRQTSIATLNKNIKNDFLFISTTSSTGYLISLNNSSFGVFSSHSSLYSLCLIIPKLFSPLSAPIP